MEPSTQLRLAIALVIVKHTPRGRSFAAHIAELCRRFPVDRASKGNNVNDVERWHERALFLEDELRALKRKADADAADMVILRASKSGAVLEPQKKKKKVAKDAVIDVDNHHTVPEPSMPSALDISSSQTALQAYERAIDIADLLTGTDTSTADKSAYTQLFLSSSLDALHAISGSLDSAISTSRSSPRESCHSTLSTIDFMLPPLLERTLSLDCFTEVLINVLLFDIIVPCLKSFNTLSLQALESLSRPKATLTYTDLRPEILLLLKRTIEALAVEAHEDQSGELLYAAASHTVEELYLLFDDDAPKDNCQRRLQRLALDDTVWYLCTILQDLLKHTCYRDQLLGSLLDLYNTHHTETSAVISSMLLGLLERNW